MSWLFNLFDANHPNTPARQHPPDPPPAATRPTPPPSGVTQQQQLQPTDDLGRTIYNPYWGASSPSASGPPDPRPRPGYPAGEAAPSVPSSSRPLPSEPVYQPPPGPPPPMIPNRPSWQQSGSSRGFSITWSSGSRPQTRTWQSTGQAANPMADVLMGVRPGGQTMLMPAGGGALMGGIPLSALAGGAGGLAGPLGGVGAASEGFRTPRGPPPPDPLDPRNQSPSRYGDEASVSAPPPAASTSRSDAPSYSPHLDGPGPKAPPRPNASSPVKCGCCGSTLRYPPESPCFRCTICGVVWDIPRATAEDDDGADFRMTRDHVDALKTARQRADDHEGGQDFADLASALLSALFLSVSSLSSAFLRPPSSPTLHSPTSDKPAIPTRPETRLDLKTLRGFYDVLCSHPASRALLIGSIERFLTRPGRDLFVITSSVDGQDDRPAAKRIPSSRQFLWSIVLLECPLFTSHATSSDEGIPPSLRTVLLGKLFGLVSSLSNARHQHLVAFWKSASYTAQMLEAKVNLLNGFVGERIRHWTEAGGLPGQGEGRAKALQADWAMRVASRVMALLFAANLASHKLPLTAFYNISIDVLPPVSLISDFEAWEHRHASSSTGPSPSSPANAYAFCAYPFLISLASKITLLSYEQKRSMGNEARTAFIESIMGRRFAPPVLQVNVRREYIVQDSLREIEAAGMDLKKLLKINFVNEEGLDGGGLKKEWFLLLCRQLLDPSYGMFTPPDPDSGMIWFNPASLETGSEFHLIGVILGLAIYNRATLDVPIPLACFKKLLGNPVGLDDLAVFRPALARGLRAMLEWEDGDVQDVFCRSMVGEYEAFGEIQEVPLSPGGQDVPVTNANRAEYVQLYVDFVLSRSIAHQFESFAAGFRRVASGNALSLFRAEEIELLIRGSEEPLDLGQLRSVTVYEGFPLGDDDPTVRLFWTFFGSLDPQGQRKLLGFITGSDRIPATGTAELRLKITRHGDGDDGRLPTSHTCFDQLLLPAFKSQDLLDRKMKAAMEESEGFGLR